MSEQEHYFLIDKLREHMIQYGYMPLRLPEIADADLFLTRAGDNIIDQLFIFQHRNERFALRPEFTALAAQHYLDRQLSSPVRWQMHGSIYQDNGKGMTRQGMSVGAEFIGSADYEADAEMIAMAVSGIRHLDIHDWELDIGHAGLQRALLKSLKIENRLQEMMLSRRDDYKKGRSIDEVLGSVINKTHSTGYTNQDSSQIEVVQYMEMSYALDLLFSSTRYGNAMGGRSRHEITERLLKKHQRVLVKQDIERAWALLHEWSQIHAPIDKAFEAIRTLLSQYSLDNDEELSVLLDNWSLVIKALEDYKIPVSKIVIQPDLTRSWNYYTGVVFGVRHASGHYLASGGRYDDLIRLVSHGKQDTPAVGVAFYLQNLPTMSLSTPATITLGGYGARQIAQLLREKGLNVVLSIEHNDNCDINLEKDSVVLYGERFAFITQQELLIILEERLS